jgi:hypothetical protein
VTPADLKIRILEDLRRQKRLLPGALKIRSRIAKTQQKCWPYSTFEHDRLPQWESPGQDSGGIFMEFWSNFGRCLIDFEFLIDPGSQKHKGGFNSEGCWAHFIRVWIEFELILINFSLILDAKNTRVASTAKAAERILFEFELNLNWFCSFFH